MKTRRLLILMLCGVMLCGTCMSSCRKTPPSDDDPTVPGDSETETQPDPGTDDPGYVEPVLTGPYADTIMQANRLADGVQAYYANPSRTAFCIENQNMSLEYALASSASNRVTVLRNAGGAAYLEDSMDVFVTMADGKTYFASDSTSAPHANVYRLGYYYYDVHLLGQNFMSASGVSAQMQFAITKSNIRSKDVADLKVEDGVISYTANGVDPYVYTLKNTTKKGLCFKAEDYNAIQFTVKTAATRGELYLMAGGRDGHSPDQCIPFTLEGSGEWTTYTLMLNTIQDYTGIVTSLRFDIGDPGQTVEIKDIKAVKMDQSVPALLLDRTFHTYSDKVNQVMHFVASERVTGIASLGMITHLPANTVEKLIIKDKNGTHTSLDGVDFDSCEYVGFDIKDAGVLGFILLAHQNSGKLEISLADGTYTVVQSACPEGGELLADPDSTDDDFYMGHRLYTDASHDFDAFLAEAENERHPLETFGGEQYLGYDALRGAYCYTIGGTDFNKPFFTEQNRHYTADVSVTGDKTDRNVYVYTHFSGGCCENALIMDKSNMLLPIPVMIYKNFKGENEEPIFDPGDTSYSEAYFPLTVKAGEKTELTVLNLYMNWGKMPLKQLSSIQYFWPYYHLSLGTTETSCISPLYGARDLWTLPDFRSMSMPYWFELPQGQGYGNQPQHTHGGFQYFLQYTDAKGNYSASENYHNDIISSGPVYTDVKMDYISDDGRIKVSYNHVELPETDELRAYYEINYEILADIEFADFAKDFSFYSVEGYAGAYKKIGYLDKDNRTVQGTVNASDQPEVLKLGDQYPYVALYDLETSDASWAFNNVNIGFVVYDSEMTVGGQKCDAGFVVVGKNSKYSLSLDLEGVTLKAGDTLKLCLIISPWGFYTSKDDSNMQTIRQNTCIDGLKLTVQDGEAMEYVYVPSLKSTNGKSAEFTVSGGSDNKVVRVYGFDKLTAPEVYEKVNGEWVKLTLSSADTPDAAGYAHGYDGYAVYYDRNGTYSYAFAFNMDGKDSRTFRMVCENDNTPIPDDEQTPEQQSACLVTLKAADLALAAQGEARGFGKVELAQDGSYVRLYGDGSSGEAFFDAYRSENLDPTGQYLAIKYRIPQNQSDKVGFEFFTSTENASAVAGECFETRELICDGQWHVLVVNLASQSLPTFKADSAGKYCARYLRFDVFNARASVQTYVDLAYLLISDDLADICEQNGSGRGEVYKNGVISGSIDFASGKMEMSGGAMGGFAQYVDPASGFTVSELRYGATVDFINGVGDGDGAYNNRTSSQDKGLELFDYNGKTVDGGKLALAGWAVAKGGIDRYVWSADGGKTWQDCTLYGRSSFGTLTADAGIAVAGNNLLAGTGYDVMEHPDKIVFQGAEGMPSGICADLSAYAGQTVDVVFALVPLEDADGLCLVGVVCGVSVEG